MARWLVAFFLVAGLSGPSRAQAPVWLDTLNLHGFIQGRGEARANRSQDGKPLTIAGQVFAHGVGTNADSECTLDLQGGARSFEAWVGVDDDVKPHGRLVFQVLVDGVPRYNSGLMKSQDRARQVDVDLRGARQLTLRVQDAGAEIYQDHGDWALARILTTVPPRPLVLGPAGTVRRTPPSGPRPRLCGPMVASARPGSPFSFSLRATGRRPLKLAVGALPSGLTWDGDFALISGTVAGPGTWRVPLTASNALGKDERTLKIVIGPQLGLTPAMGWNSWNAWGDQVDDAKIRAAADQMVASGLASHGWTYINLDDGWAGGRDPQGQIQPNPKFPDMKGLVDYIHSRGLKFGIYSSPGPKTCAGYQGSFGHEAPDAQTFAAWGVDYLKYDWCSCTSPDPQAPYRLMSEALAACPRDILFSMCQYGRDQVWTWGAAYGQSWRTTGDIDDVWGSILGIGFAQDGLQPYAGPGHFNDPDMLVVGKLGWGLSVRPTRLNPDEQYSHLSLWSLLAAPLLIGCDLDRLDSFTLGLLSNDEVIDIDQDPAGRQGWRLAREGSAQVWGRPLSDGSWALGFFNLGLSPRTVSFDLRKLALLGRVRVRDVWRQQELGRREGLVSLPVAPHGAELVRVWP